MDDDYAKVIENTRVAFRILDDLTAGKEAANIDAQTRAERTVQAKALYTDMRAAFERLENAGASEDSSLTSDMLASVKTRVDQLLKAIALAAHAVNMR